MWFAPHDNVREITKEEIGVNLAQKTISAEKQHVGTYPFRVLCPAHGHRPNPLDSPPLAVSYRFRIAIRSVQKTLATAPLVTAISLAAMPACCSSSHQRLATATPTRSEQTAQPACEAVPHSRGRLDTPQR